MNNRISFLISSNLPENKYETYSFEGKNFLLVRFEGSFTFTNGPFRFLLIPDDNSESAKKIKNGTAYGKYYTTSFTNLKLLKDEP